MRRASMRSSCVLYRNVFKYSSEKAKLSWLTGVTRLSAKENENVVFDQYFTRIFEYKHICGYHMKKAMQTVYTFESIKSPLQHIL